MEPFNLSKWFQQKKTKEFITELEASFGEVKKSGRGRGHHTWVHPYLFIDIALAISPKLKIEAYSWLYDHLLKYRNDSGDSYKRMCGSLWARASNKKNFQDDIKKIAKLIRVECGGVKDWQHATDEQLRRRDKYHDNIALLAEVLNSNSEAVRLGILKTNKYFSEIEKAD